MNRAPRSLLFACMAAAVALAPLAGCHRNNRAQAARMSFGASIADIELDGTHYSGHWSDDTKAFAGTIQWTGQAAKSAVPLITHEVLVTTGEYSDPKVVQIEPVVDHHTTWKYVARRQAEGTIHIVHCVPSSPEIYDALGALTVGQNVSIEGALLSGQLKGTDGAYWQTGKESHPTVFVRGVHVEAAQ
jgi:hypothetical protein